MRGTTLLAKSFINKSSPSSKTLKISLQISHFTLTNNNAFFSTFNQKSTKNQLNKQTFFPFLFTTTNFKRNFSTNQINNTTPFSSGAPFIKITKEEEEKIASKQITKWLTETPIFRTFQTNFPLENSSNKLFSSEEKILPLLLIAFTHKSFHFKKNISHNFNLQSYGMSYIKVVLSQYLIRKNKDQKDIVNSIQKILNYYLHPTNLFPIAKQLQIIPLLRYQLTKGTIHLREEIIAGGLTSLVAALQITQGTEMTSSFIIEKIAGDRLKEPLSVLLLQIPTELLKTFFSIPPIYKVLEEEIIGENLDGTVEKQYKVGVYSSESEDKLLASEWSHDIYLAKIKAAESAIKFLRSEYVL